MQILKNWRKSKIEKTIVQEVQSNKGEKFSYLGMIDNKYKGKVKSLENEIKELEASEKEVLESISQVRKEGQRDGELLTIINKLREKIETSNKQLNKVRVDFENMTLGLRLMANELDMIDRKNMIVDLYQFLGTKVNEMLPILNKIEIISGGNYYAPSSCSTIKAVTLNNLIPNLQMELSRLHKTDEKSKKELVERFQKEMERVDSEVDKTINVSEKYKTLLSK